MPEKIMTASKRRSWGLIRSFIMTLIIESMTYYSANHAAEPKMTDCRVPFVPPVPHMDKRDSGTRRDALRNKYLRQKSEAPAHECAEASKVSRSRP